MEVTPRESWVTQSMINKMDERRKTKTIDVKEYKRLNNQMRR